MHRMNHASVAHKVTIFKEQSQPNKFHSKTETQFNEYILQIDLTFAVPFQSQVQEYAASPLQVPLACNFCNKVYSFFLLFCLLWSQRYSITIIEYLKGVFNNKNVRYYDTKTLSVVVVLMSSWWNSTISSRYSSLTSFAIFKASGFTRISKGYPILQSGTFDAARIGLSMGTKLRTSKASSSGSLYLKLSKHFFLVYFICMHI